MTSVPRILSSRCDPAARITVRAWRALSGGATARDDERPTLIACSAGADSSALAICLAPVRRAHLVIAHVVHDMRPSAEATLDRDAARELAARLNRPFVEAAISVRALRANAESAARALRYRALASLAHDNGCCYVSTAHHADDVLETILMRLLRGSGPRGFSAIAPSRRLSHAVTLIRPMLSVTRDDCQRLCGAAGWAWREDLTNADTSRLRAALRARVVPALRDLSPHVLSRAGATADVLRDAADFITLHARRALDEARAGASFRCPRSALRALHPAVLTELLRLAAADLGNGRRRDKVNFTALVRARDAITRPGTEPRSLMLGAAHLRVSAHDVRIECAVGLERPA